MTDYNALQKMHQNEVDRWRTSMRKLDAEINHPAVARHGALCRELGVPRSSCPFEGHGTAYTGEAWALVWLRGWDGPGWYGRKAGDVREDAVMPAPPKLARIDYPKIPDALARRPQLRCTGNAKWLDSQSSGPYHGK